MKRILYLVLMIAVFAACKKSQKELPTDEELSINDGSLTGTWKEQVQPYSRMLASTLTLRANSTYSWLGSVSLITPQGTYQAKVTSNPKVFNVTFTGTVADASYNTLIIEMISGNQISISTGVTPGGGAARKFVREQ